MASERLRGWLTLACALCVLAGCTSVPPIPKNAHYSSGDGKDEDEGWLFKKLTGQNKKADGSSATNAANPSTSINPANPSAPGGVQQASVSIPQSEIQGPLVPGPASSTLYRSAPKSGLGSAPDFTNTTAGPPPTIPPELPPPPAGSVSIKDIKDKPAEKKGFEWSDLAPENVWKNIKVAAGYGPDEKIARAAMKEGQDLFRQKKFKEAAAKFATVAFRWPDSPLEEDALFLQGECEFFSDQYPKAHDTYGGLLKKYSNTRHLDTVMSREFALGRYWEQLHDANPKWPVTPNVTDSSRPRFDTFGYAIQSYERVHMNDPTGPLADSSLMALGNAYFRRGQYEDAAHNYDMLRKEYPNSQHQMNAHILGLQAKMRMYQGTSYDETPLKDSAKLARQTLTQYGAKLGDERRRIAESEAMISEEQANREFTLGKYYENRKFYGAARIYYKSVIDDFPGTQKAKEAQARFEAIRDKPSEPPGDFAWLTGMFGTKK
jgi:outer membrane protein assembly factor BamD (BamD/ComL family)